MLTGDIASALLMTNTTGSLKTYSDILDRKMIAMDAIHVIQDLYPGQLEAIYESGEVNPNGMLKAIAAKRNLVRENNEPDTKRAAEMFLNELRKGRLGRLSLEHVHEEDTEEHPE